MDKKITFKSKPISLMGRMIQENVYAPRFHALNQNLEEVKLADFGDNIKIITSFPSLDTDVCSKQVRKFNQEAHQIKEDITVIGISQDLPFAQKRFAEENSIDKLILLSDYKSHSFGINYGFLIRELQLLTRTVMILDENNIIRYIQMAQEISNALDSDKTLEALKRVISNPVAQEPKEGAFHCVRCEPGTPALEKERVEELLETVDDWKTVDHKEISKEFKFKNFSQAKYFVDVLSVMAQDQGHHPDMTIEYNKVKVSLSTHSIGGLSDNDFIMAGLINRVQI